MTRKLKILIHSMTFKRDFGATYILSKLLERLGCECIIAHNTNYLSKPFRMWNPDAVFFVTLGRTERIMKAYPGAKFFLWTGEGGERPEYLEEVKVVNSKELFDRFSKVYLWGESAMQHVKEAVRNEGARHFLHGRENLIDGKFRIVSNPRNDLIKYSPDLKKGAKIRIGLIGTFWLINPTFPSFNMMNYLLESGKHNDRLTEEASFQVRFLNHVYHLVNKLDPEKYEFSIRPYPLESFNAYRDGKFFRESGISMDDSIDFGSWMNRQDLIIGTTSSTSCQLAIARKPFINLDEMCGRPPEYFENILIPKELISDSRRNCPENEREMFDMIGKYEDYRLTSPEIEKSFSWLYNISYPHSSLAETAKGIVGILRESRMPETSGISRNMAMLLDRINMSYRNFRNSREMSFDYSFFMPGKVMEKAKAEFDPVYEKIISAPENMEFLD